VSPAYVSRLVTAVVLAVATLCACASPPPIPTQKQGEGELAPQYKLGPGDQINVFVFNHPELSGEFTIRPDGMISTPLVEDIAATGKTSSELARDIEKALAEYVRSPTVNVIVRSFVGSFADQIRVVGQAVQPQVVPYRANMTLLDVMIQVGGLREFAAGNRAQLVRRVDGKEVSTRVRLDDLLNGGDLKANVAMQPGDVIIVPESRF
jgi:polysaccharide biosynthesis/export protein